MGCFFSTHTLCGMLVFLDHIRKATTRQHSALTTALQNVPNEYTAEGSRGGEICRGNGREVNIFPGALDARHVAVFRSPLVLLITLWGAVVSILLSRQWRMKTAGLEDPDPSPSFAVWSGCTKRELPYPLNSPLRITIIPSPWRKLRLTHHVTSET